MTLPAGKDVSLLTEFDRDGCNALADLIADNPDKARAWIEQNLARIQILYRSLGETSALDGPRPVGAGEKPGSRKQSQNQEPRASAEERFGKIRVGLMIDFVVFDHLTNAPRAVSVDSVFSALRDAGLIAPNARPALITRLNRMKDKALLDWYKSTRAQDIRMTEDGRKYADKLRDRILTKDEMSYLARMREAKAKVVNIAKTNAQ